MHVGAIVFKKVTKGSLVQNVGCQLKFGAKYFDLRVLKVHILLY